MKSDFVGGTSLTGLGIGADLAFLFTLQYGAEARERLEQSVLHEPERRRKTQRRSQRVNSHSEDETIECWSKPEKA